MTAPSSFFKPSAAEHGAIAATSVYKMAIADSFIQWLMCRPEWWWAVNWDGKLKRQRSIVFSLILKVRVCLVLLLPQEVDQRFQVSVL